MERSTEQTYVLNAIASLRNELLARDDARQLSIAAIVEHLHTLNGKTAKHSRAVSRLNLLVFGVGGPVGLAYLGAFFLRWLSK